MARKAAKPQHVEPEDESQDVPEEQAALESTEPDDEPETGGGSISKAEAIRRALAAGHEGPQEGTAYIRKEFGIEVTPQHWSASKSQMKSREAKKQGSGGAAARPKGRPGRKPKEGAPSQTVEGSLSPPPKQRGSSGEPELLEAMEAMKPLVASLGVERVKRIAELLG